MPNAGITAIQSAGVAAGASDENVPVSKITNFDFVAGVYTYDGNSITDAEAIDTPERITVDGFDVLDGETEGGALVLGSASADLRKQWWTLDIEWEQFDHPNLNPYLLFIQPSIGGSVGIFIYVSGGGLQVDCQSGVVLRTNDQSAITLTPGNHRLSVTCSPDVLESSLDGNAVETDATSAAKFQADVSGIGEFIDIDGIRYSNNHCFIRELRITPPDLTANLPGRSTP